MEAKARFVFICVKYGLTEPLAWRLFDYIQAREGLISEYETRLYLGLGEEKTRQLIYELVKNQYATEDTEYDANGVAYVDEVADEDVDLLAEVELGGSQTVMAIVATINLVAVSHRINEI